MTPRGPFDLQFQNRYFNGWPTLPDSDTIVMAFPVEGWAGTAAVTMRQDGAEVAVRVVGSPDLHQAAEAQALAAVSLDVDGELWPALGQRVPAIGELQQRYRFLRPSMFHSPYEAAAAFVIGHRISVVQARRIRQRLAEQIGDTVEIDGVGFPAFPSPQTLLELREVPGLAAAKIERLHGVARSALDGLLDRPRLRAVEHAEALAQLQTIPGIGPFFAQAILYRGVGRPDGYVTDPVSVEGVQWALGLDAPPAAEDVGTLTAEWGPLRMWALVLLHLHLVETRGQHGRPGR